MRLIVHLPYILVPLVISLVMLQTVIVLPVFAAKEFCYGRSSGTIEFICREGNHYRSVDCDQIVGDNGLCYSNECTIQKEFPSKDFEPCRDWRLAFNNAMKNEPLCVRCSSIVAPVYDG